MTDVPCEGTLSVIAVVRCRRNSSWPRKLQCRRRPIPGLRRRMTLHAEIPTVRMIRARSGCARMRQITISAHSIAAGGRSRSGSGKFRSGSAERRRSAAAGTAVFSCALSRCGVRLHGFCVRLPQRFKQGNGDAVGQIQTAVEGSLHGYQPHQVGVTGIKRRRKP